MEYDGICYFFSSVTWKNGTETLKLTWEAGASETSIKPGPPDNEATASFWKSCLAGHDKTCVDWLPPICQQVKRTTRNMLSETNKQPPRKGPVNPRHLLYSTIFPEMWEHELTRNCKKNTFDLIQISNLENDFISIFSILSLFAWKTTGVTEKKKKTAPRGARLSAAPTGREILEVSESDPPSFWVHLCDRSKLTDLGSRPLLHNSKQDLEKFGQTVVAVKSNCWVPSFIILETLVKYHWRFSEKNLKGVCFQFDEPI